MTGFGAVVGLLVGLPLLLARGSRRSVVAGSTWRARARTARPARDDGRAPGGSWRARLRRQPHDDGGALAASLVEVASMLRAGVAPADAWTRVLRVPVPDRVPTVAQLAATTGAGASAGSRDGRSGRRGAAIGSAAPGARRAHDGSGTPLEAVVAAARVADELGAPLAAVLDQVAAAIAAQAEATADVEAALAGPRSSARVLAWLPVLGLLLGTALGANPLGVLLGGGLGTAAGVLGLVLVLVGRWWTGALLRRAGRAGSDP